MSEGDGADRMISRRSALGALVGVWVAGCRDPEGSPSIVAGGGGRHRLVCTTGMVADAVRHIAGERAEVIALFGPGVDPHKYRAKPSDVRRLRAADGIFYSGLHLEGRLADVLGRLAARRPTFALASTIPTDRLLKEEESGPADPHVWFDVSLWRETIPAVIGGLASIDPDGETSFRANAAKLGASWDKLHLETKSRIKTIPEDRRLLVTAHDAFAYFGRQYGIEVRGIQGISTEDEAGVRHIDGLVDEIVRRKLPAVFVETSVSDRNLRALLEGCAARGHEVRIGGELYSDALGEPGSPGEDYEGMIRHNVEAIVSGLS